MADTQTRIIFSVITPTYNRVETLHRVYNSLQQQTIKQFEWIVVDDGSTDNTSSKITAWQVESPFPIVYVMQENMGKPSAVNRGVGLAKGDYVVILDSDDACKANAMEKMLCAWQQIPENKREGFVGITGLCEDQNGRLVGEKFPTDTLDASALELSYCYKTQGEKWGFLRTDVLREIPQPMVDGFIPESIWWHSIAKKYKTRYINEIVRIYYVDDAETEQLSSISDPFKHAKGHAYWHQWVLNEEIAYFWKAPMVFLRSGVHYSRFSLMSRLGFYSQYCGLNNLLAKLLWVISLPVGLVVYLRDGVGEVNK